MALCYCLGISDDTEETLTVSMTLRQKVRQTQRAYEAGRQAEVKKKIVRMAFNLYCNGTPSVDEDTTTDERLYECRQYSVEELFCCEYALYFWQAVQIRYPEYTSCNPKLSELTEDKDKC